MAGALGSGKAHHIDLMIYSAVSIYCAFVSVSDIIALRTGGGKDRACVFTFVYYHSRGVSGRGEPNSKILTHESISGYLDVQSSEREMSNLSAYSSSGQQR